MRDTVLRLSLHLISQSQATSCFHLYFWPTPYKPTLCNAPWFGLSDILEKYTEYTRHAYWFIIKNTARTRPGWGVKEVYGELLYSLICWTCFQRLSNASLIKRSLIFSMCIFLNFSFLFIFFCDYYIVISYFSSISSLQTLLYSLLSFKFTASFSTNFYYMHICIHR